MTGVISLRDQQGRRSGIKVPSRTQIGWLLVVAGVVLLVIGWYEISGLAVVSQQTPYLASASIPGAALVVAGSILVGGDTAGRRLGRMEQMLAELHGALLEEPGEQEAAQPQERSRPDKPPDGEALFAVPDGSTYHRPTCALVAGKPEAAPVTPDEIGRRQLRPCPVCEPPQV